MGGMGGTLAMQNWKPQDFDYCVQDGKVHEFTIENSLVKLGETTDKNFQEFISKDKAALQNYGRPYSDGGKPSGTYIQNAMEPKFGPGGILKWPPAEDKPDMKEADADPICKVTVAEAPAKVVVDEEES